MTMRNFGDEWLAALPPTTRARHVGLGPRFINENETGWINPALIFFPTFASARDVGPILLDGEQGFF
jgi:hypothetical protein